MSDAISIYTDFKVYEEEVAGFMHERLAENINIFNEASRGSIVLVNDVHPGHYLKSSLFTRVSGLVTRQDISSTSAVDSKKLSQDEEISVKRHIKVGPVQVTPKSYKVAGLPYNEDPAAILAGQFADDLTKYMVDSAIISAKAAVLGQTSLLYDITDTAAPTANLKAIMRTKMKWGDQASKLACVVMHSVPYTDLWEDKLNYALESVAGFGIASGEVGNALGAGLIVTDNSNLINTTPDPDQYYSLLLAPGAVVVRMSEAMEWASERHTGFEQILYEFQGETAITLQVNGFKWDTGNGSLNPTDATLGTSTNWDKITSQTKDVPITCLISQ